MPYYSTELLPYNTTILLPFIFIPFFKRVVTINWIIQQTCYLLDEEIYSKMAEIHENISL